MHHERAMPSSDDSEAASCVVLAVVPALWIIRSITAPINEAVDVSRAVARRDLSLAGAAGSLAEESAAAAESLKQSAQQLVQVVAMPRA